MTARRNSAGPLAEARIPPAAGGAVQSCRSQLTPIFGRLLMLQQQTAQASQAGQWARLGELDNQLRKTLAELAPHRPHLTEQQQALLRRFAEQYRQHWQQVHQQAEQLEQQLGDLRRQHQGTLAYDWISQLEEGS